MSYSPKNKPKGQNPFRKNKVNNEEFLYRVKENIDEEYCKAILSDDWSNYNFVYGMYYNYTLNGGNSRYIDVVMKDYKNQYERQRGQEIDELQNVVETKPKSFEEIPREEKIKFVNKQIDDLLNFIETNKQAKYNQWKKEFYNG